MSQSNLLAHRNLIRGGLRKYLDAGLDIPKIGIKGHFKVELISRGGIIKQVLEFDNLITNAGLDGLSTNSVNTLCAYAGVGTGSTAPANTDTTLVTEITPQSSNRAASSGSGGRTNTYVSGTPDYGQQTQTYTFDFTQSNGNLTEIGLFSASSSGTMFTRQLLKDSGGTPTTITKTSSDQLKITYTLRAVPIQSDATGSITISTVSYDFTIRALNVSGYAYTTGIFTTAFNGGLTGGNMQCYSGALGTRTADTPAGTVASPTTTSAAAYTSGNYYLDVTTVWGSTVANFGAGGVQSFIGLYVGARAMQYGFSVGIPKDSTKQLTMVTRISWGRYP